jgi:hypothetical protein
MKRTAAGSRSERPAGSGCRLKTTHLRLTATGAIATGVEGEPVATSIDRSRLLARRFTLLCVALPRYGCAVSDYLGIRVAFAL